MHTSRHAMLAGLAAGAAGTTALNATTYLDIAWRGRPPSSTPDESVEKLAALAHVSIPGSGETRKNRVSGIGALLGMVTGVQTGASAAMLTRRLDLPFPVLAAGMTLGATVGSNIPMTLLGITDPRTWSAADWASDVVPHLAYGLVGAAVLRALRR